MQKSLYTNCFSLKGEVLDKWDLYYRLYCPLYPQIEIKMEWKSRLRDFVTIVGSNNFSSLFLSTKGSSHEKYHVKRRLCCNFNPWITGEVSRNSAESNGGNLSLPFGWLIVLVDRNYEHRPKRHARPVKTEPIDRSIVEQQNHYLLQAFKHKVNCFSSFKWDCSVGSHRVAPVPRHRGKMCTLHSIW